MLTKRPLGRGDLGLATPWAEAAGKAHVQPTRGGRACARTHMSACMQARPWRRAVAALTGREARRRPGLRERVDPAGDSPDPVVETRGRVADLGARSSGDGGILRERRSL